MKQRIRKMFDENLSDFGHLSDAQLAGLTAYAEVRGENPLVQAIVAVVTVIMERVEYRDWDGKTVKEVCLLPYQFSCYLPDDPQRSKLLTLAENFATSYVSSKILKLCVDIAQGIMDGKIPRDADLVAAKCCQYLNPRTAAKQKAEWMKAGMTVIKTIGNHEFFKE